MRKLQYASLPGRISVLKEQLQARNEILGLCSLHTAVLHRTNTPEVAAVERYLPHFPLQKVHACQTGWQGLQL